MFKVTVLFGGLPIPLFWTPNDICPAFQTQGLRFVYTYRLHPRIRLSHRQIYTDWQNGFRTQSAKVKRSVAIVTGRKRR